MSNLKEQKMKPGEFRFSPSGNWVVIDIIHIESKEEKAARRANLDIVTADPKNLMDIERKSAKEHLTYQEYVKDAVNTFDGKHGFQGIVKATGPLFNSDEEGYKVGDKVYHRGNSGEPMVHNKRLYWMLKPHEIYGKAPKNEHDI